MAATMVVAAFSITAAYAQNARNRWFPEKQNFGAFAERVNANTVTIVSGSPDGAYLSIAHDLSAVLAVETADLVAAPKSVEEIGRGDAQIDALQKANVTNVLAAALADEG